jgi:hypothetical protein
MHISLRELSFCLHPQLYANIFLTTQLAMHELHLICDTENLDNNLDPTVPHPLAAM